MIKYAEWVMGRFGDKGDAWLKRLPDIIDELSDNWHLSRIIPQTTSNYNYTAFCIARNSLKVFLKIGYPESEIRTEIAALQDFDCDCVIKPLAVDTEKNAILLPRLIPGTSLHNLDNEEKQNIIAASLISDLKNPQKTEYDYPALTKWFCVISDFLKNNNLSIPRKHLLAAWEIFLELEKEEFTPALLHGDLHHYNILKHEDKRMIIDPKGVTGNPLYETACFMYNPSPQFLKYRNLNKIIQKRLAMFSEILGFPVDQMAAMAYCQSVLSACWCLQDQEDCWENALFCADLFYSFL